MAAPTFVSMMMEDTTANVQMGLDWMEITTAWVMIYSIISRNKILATGLVKMRSHDKRYVYPRRLGQQK